MHTALIRAYKSIHTWTGIFCSLALFIAFFAGALTIFEQPLSRWLTPPAEELPALSYAKVDQLIPQVITHHPDAAKALVLHLDEGATSTSPLRWQEQQWHAGLDAQGALIAKQTGGSHFARFIDELHQTAGIPGKLGHDHLGVYVMGLVSALYFIALISGLIILLPTFSRDFLALRRGQNKKRFWLDLHNVFGVSAFPFHLIIALTALVFAFHDLFYGALQVSAYKDKRMFAPPAVQAIENQSIEKLLPVETLLQRIHSVAPAFKVREIDYRNLDTPKALARVGGLSDGEIVRGPHYGYMLVQPFSGEIISADLTPGKMDRWSQIVSHFFALHFGNYGGQPVRWLYFLMGIGGAVVFFSGNLLWIESRRKKQRNGGAAPEQSRATRVMACLTIGISFGCIAGVGLSLVAAKWLYGLVDDLNLWHSLIYYGVFLLSLCWAFWRRAAAAFELPLLCGVAALLIPISSWLSTQLSALPAWFNADSIAVDITAGVVGLLLCSAALFTRRKLYALSRDSVWAM